MSANRYLPVVGAFEARNYLEPDAGKSCYFWLNGDRYIRCPQSPAGFVKSPPRLSLRQEPMNDIEVRARKASIDYAYRRGNQWISFTPTSQFDPQLAYPVGPETPVVPVEATPRPKPEGNITPGDIVTWPDRVTGYAGDPAKQYLVIGSSIGRCVSKYHGRSTPEGVQLTDGRETWNVRDASKLVKCGRMA
jgi:hypothetical protein